VPNSEVHRFLQELDIFVMPSRILPDHQEHDGRALIEALAAGVPTVGTRSGVIPEILGDGTGVLVEPSAPDALAAAIGDLARDPEMRGVLAQLGRGKAEQEFSVSQVVAQRLEIYRRVSR
jgi:glycosyltransferase involved in cell wall biosynthesis